MNIQTKTLINGAVGNEVLRRCDISINDLVQLVSAQTSVLGVTRLMQERGCDYTSHKSAGTMCVERIDVPFGDEDIGATASLIFERGNVVLAKMVIEAPDVGEDRLATAFRYLLDLIQAPFPCGEHQRVNDLDAVEQANMSAYRIGNGGQTLVIELSPYDPALDAAEGA